MSFLLRKVAIIKAIITSLYLISSRATFFDGPIGMAVQSPPNNDSVVYEAERLATVTILSDPIST